MAARKKRRRKKKPTRASVGYSIGILALFALVVFLGLSLYGLFAPRSSREVTSSVLVLNGCGVGGVAERATKLLRGHGLDVVDYRNAERFDYAETLVIDRTGDMGAAIAVAKILRVPNVIQQIPETPLVDIIVVIGADHERYLPS